MAVHTDVRPHRVARQLVITGMHRSGTSLAASVLQRAGLDVGERLLRPGVGNPRGHFEDEDLVALHEAMLAAAGRHVFDAAGDLSPPPGSELEARAGALVAARAARPLWGWKDPRTCLFLELWDRLLPDGRYLFLYRHPADVVLSLWRRHVDLDPRRDPWVALVDFSRDPWLAVRSWEAHSRRLLEYLDRRPERCFVAHAPTFAADLPGFVARVAAKLDLPLAPAAAGTPFVPDELAETVDGLALDWDAVLPDAMAIYRSLQRLADIPAPPAPAGDAGGRAPAGGRNAVVATDRERQQRHATVAILQSLLASRSRDGGDPLTIAEARARLEVETERRIALENALQTTDRQVELVAAELASARLQGGQLAAGLAAERQRSHVLAAELAASRSQLAAARERCDELAATLARIEGARAFALVRWWWRLRGGRPGG